MSLVRKILVIFSLLFLIWIFGILQVDTAQIYHSKTLVSLGFILLAAYSFGEITFRLGLPRISGYLIAGIIFGPYSSFIFQTNFFSVFTEEVVKDLKLLNGLAIGLIALTAGGEIKLIDLKENYKTISLIVLFKTILMLVVLIPIIWFASHYIPFFNNIDSNQVIALSILISILMIATSPAATIAVINETGDKSKLSKLVLNTAVAKDIVIVTLLGFALAFSENLLNPQSAFEWSVIFHSLIELLVSILVGVVFALLILAYFKFIKEEKLIFLLFFILIVNEINEALNLHSLLVFISIGFFLQNFSKYGEDLIEPIERLSMPVYVIFFTIAGAGLDLNSFSLAYQITILIFVIRLILIYLATNVSLKILNEKIELKKNLWMGFISQSGVVLGLTIIISAEFPQLENSLSPIMISLVGLHLLFGPALFRFAIRRFNPTYEKKEEVKIAEKKAPVKETIQDKKFSLPEFVDPKLNELVLDLRNKLISHLKEFQNHLINKRSEESIEFYYQVVEKYIDEYQNLKNLFTSGKVSGWELKNYILKIQQDIAHWFNEISIARKKTEQQILFAENLLQELFEELKIYSESVPDVVIVEQEEDKYIEGTKDNLLLKIVKSLKRTDRKLRLWLKIKNKLTRKIPFVTLVKYYFDYQIPLEMEKVAFMLGMERLNVLRKTKKLYDDVTINLEELLNLIAEHKDIEAVSTIAIDKLNEIHDKLKTEISSIGEEIELSNQNINSRLVYAFANPFNNFLDALNLAGTFGFNIKKYHFSKVYEKSIQAKETTLETIRFWVNYLIGFLGICERDAKIYELTGEINSVIDETMINYSDSVNEILREVINRLSQKFKEFEKDISDKNLISSKNTIKVKALIEKFKNELIDLISEEGITKLNIVRKTNNLSVIIPVLRQNFNSIIGQYDREIKVLDEKDLDIRETRTRYIELKTLHFSDILKSFFENEILQEILKINEIISGYLNSSILELKNIESIIHYHLDIALEEIDKVSDEEDLNAVFNETLKESIKLLREKTKSWSRQIEKFEREIDLSLTEKVYNQISKFKDLVRSEPTEHLERLIKPPLYLTILIKIEKQIEITLRKLRFIFVKIKNQIKPLVRELKEALEISWDEKGIIIHSYKETTVSKDILQTLPFVYRRLFDYTVSEVTEMIVGRDKEKEILKEGYNRVQEGLAGSVAIIGESGTGKSSLINYFLRDLESEKFTYRFHFEKTIYSEKELLNILSRTFGMEYIQTYEELTNELLISSSPKVIILEDIHKLYLRKFGGLEAIKKLLVLISETNSKHFWIVSISFHAWQLLNRILMISNFFPFQIKTEDLSKEQIKEAILIRHNTSGLGLEFLSDEKTRLKRQFRYAFSSQDVQKLLQDEFFNQLSKACEGNITSALFYWLKSIKEFKGDKIIINPFRKLNLEFIQTLNIKKLLTLANLIQHGSLTIQEHKEIFKISDDESKAIFNFLVSANLVNFELGENGEKIFYINEAIYKPLEIELRKIHIFD